MAVDFVRGIALFRNTFIPSSGVSFRDGMMDGCDCGRLGGCIMVVIGAVAGWVY